MFKEIGYKHTVLVISKSYIETKKYHKKELSKIHKMANVCIKIYCSKNLGPITFWDTIFHKMIFGSLRENIGAEDKPHLLLILLDISMALVLSDFGSTPHSPSLASYPVSSPPSDNSNQTQALPRVSHQLFAFLACQKQKPRIQCSPIKRNQFYFRHTHNTTTKKVLQPPASNVVRWTWSLKTQNSLLKRADRAHALWPQYPTEINVNGYST